MADVLLSEAERQFVLHGVEGNVRVDGRTCTDIRPIEIETGIVSNTSGSARVKVANTDILVGVKAELDAPKIPNKGRIEFFIDCSANATPEFEGRGGEDLAMEIRSVLMLAYSSSSCLDLERLCVLPGQQAWVIYIDVLILECGGNLFDAVSLGIKAALYNTRIPNVKVSSYEGGQQEIEVSDDPFDFNQLDVLNTPVLVTLTRVGQHFIIDPTQEEECCGLAAVVLAINETGKVLTVKKLGSGSLHPDSMRESIEVGQQIGVKINKVLMQKLKEEEKSQLPPKGFLH